MPGPHALSLAEVAQAKTVCRAEAGEARGRLLQLRQVTRQMVGAIWAGPGE